LLRLRDSCACHGRPSARRLRSWNRLLRFDYSIGQRARKASRRKEAFSTSDVVVLWMKLGLVKRLSKRENGRQVVGFASQCLGANDRRLAGTNGKACQPEDS
jgi:hypothetical protein